MPDIRIVQDTGFPALAVTLDWLLKPSGVLDESQALATAVIVALGTDARAAETDVLPDPDDDDRRGWWGDLDAKSIWGGWNIGARLWLLRRAKILPPGASEGATLARVQQYIRESIQPFIAARIASQMKIEASRVDVNTIEARVTLYRGPNDTIDLRFDLLWEE